MDDGTEKGQSTCNGESGESDPSTSSSLLIYKQLLTDIGSTYPELVQGFSPEVSVLYKCTDISSEEVVEAGKKISEHSKDVLAPRFLDVLYKNEDIFSDDEIRCDFIPSIDFKIIWHGGISDDTKSVIWKYLQLILFASISQMGDSSTFGDAAKLFEAIDPTHLQEKLSETMDEMLKGLDDDDNSFIDLDKLGTELPNPQQVNDHLQQMLGGKIGALAKEIAEESIADMDDDLKGSTDVKELLAKMMKDPKRLVQMVKKVGDTLDTKLKSGDLTEAELVEEAGEMMNKLQSVPGFKDIGQMMNSLKSGKGKGFSSKILQNLKLSQKRAELRTKHSKKKATSGTAPENISAEAFKEKCREAEAAMAELLQAEESERSSKRQSGGRKKKKNKKKR